jgi:hypothetical protein
MKAALLNGFLGLSLTLGLGVKYLSLGVWDLLLAVLVSNIAALIAVLVTLQAERVPWMVKYFINRSLKTWTFLAIIYFGILLGNIPFLRAFEPLLYLSFPLILTSGFAIIVFGPIQDRIVRRQQLRERARIENSANTKNDFPCFPTDTAVL